MTAGCKIRPFKAEDISRLHEIREAAFAPVFRSFRSIVGEKIASVAFTTLEQEQAEHLDQISAEDSSHKVFVVERNDEIIGFCAISFDQKLKLGEIDLNAVDPTYQGEGIGLLMYEHALDQMKKAGMRAATVGTGGDISHAPARRAYEKAGFGPAIPNVYYYREL